MNRATTTPSRAWLGLLMVTAASLLTPAAVRAQGAANAGRPDSRWWAGGGAGYIAGRIDCTNCAEDPPYGDNAAYVFQGGVRLNDRTLVGAEVFTLGRKVNDLHLRESYLLGIVQFQPIASQGFFIKGGYGMAFVKEVIPNSPDIIRTWGMGVMYGAGWVFGLKRRVSLAPFGAHYVTTVGDVPTPLGTAENVVTNGWFAGAVVMFR